MEGFGRSLVRISLPRLLRVGQRKLHYSACLTAILILTSLSLIAQPVPKISSVSPEWIQRVSWKESKVYVDLSQRHIEAAPEFDPTLPLEREHEERLYDHLGRPKYWEREPRRKA